jgi:hypothetical protein
MFGSQSQGPLGFHFEAPTMGHALPMMVHEGQHGVAWHHCLPQGSASGRVPARGDTAWPEVV